MTACPFCSIDPGRLVAWNNVAVAVRDAYPVAEGHTLVIPRAHVASIFELPPVEQEVIWQFVGKVREQLIDECGIHDFNIGVNDGLNAGQTVPHAHIHIIPRRPGDVPDPRGGIRWIIAEKAPYWDR